MSCTGSRYEMTKIEQNGSVRMVPRMSADKLVKEGKAHILERRILVANEEILIKKKDGSFHQLPKKYAQGLIDKGEAELYVFNPKKKAKKTKKASKSATEKSGFEFDAGEGKVFKPASPKAKALEAPAKNKMVSKPKKKK